MSGALPYSELDVTALLDSHGERLYLYFWLMLGDELSATRALTDTIIGVLPDPDHRELFTVARRVCRQYQPVPALSAKAGVATLAALTIVALRRLDPDDREICVLGAPRYHLDDADLAAVLGTWTVDALRPRAAAAFGSELAVWAAEAGFEQDGNLAWQALRQLGSDAIAVPYDQIVPLATDTVLEGLREGIRTRVTGPAEAIPPLDALPLDARRTEPRAIVTFAAIQEAERPTVPLPRVPASESGRSGRRGRQALVGVALAAAIPAAIAGVIASAGHSAHTSHSVQSGPQPVPQAAPPSGVPRSTAPPAISPPAQVQGSGAGAPGDQRAAAAPMPAGAPIATAPSQVVTPAPTHSKQVKVTTSPTAPAMSPTPTVSPTVSPTTPASPTPSPQATTK